MSVRHADPDRDAAACAEIYRPHVDTGMASFELRAPDAAEMRRRIESATRTHAWLVHEVGGEVGGFAFAGPHKARAGYRWAADVAIYVGAAHVRQGLGRALYGALLPLLASQRLRWACAGVALPNPASVALHESLGFAPVGVWPKIGYKAGAWLDVAWFQLELAPGPGEPPAEPLGPQTL